MAAARGFTTPFSVRLLKRTDVAFPSGKNGMVLEVRRKKRRLLAAGELLKCCCSEIRGVCGPGKSAEKSDDRIFDPNKRPSYRDPVMPFASPQLLAEFQHCYVHAGGAGEWELKTRKNGGNEYNDLDVFQARKILLPLHPRNSGPQSRDTPPKRDTGIANEKDWGISLLSENVNETGTNEDGSTWYCESGEDLGDNGYRCRWTKMGGQSADSTSEWKETAGYQATLTQAFSPSLAKLRYFAGILTCFLPTSLWIWILSWWEKSDWTGYKELGVEKSGRNAEGDSWWETWREVLHQDEWSNLARIERSAQKQAKSGTENAGWWEKYDAKGWTEKGAHKYGRLNEQSWWEKWGEHYDGRGSILKWTDKWAETELGTKWGDKWEEKFLLALDHGKGRRGMHLLVVKVRDHKVHKYGKSTTGESWDIVVDEETYYEAEPHYGWADVVGDSTQLLSIEPRERPPGVFPNLDFGSSPPSPGEPPEPSASSE
ncbi:hypothetical protein DH2020_034825 [Rehmannia glutinosa]|uniref:Uncharacterized protein n=1 Tax=Rehmannia glutinosa TaxID=99300 RepID=A0ABR0V987_REHGL